MRKAGLALQSPVRCVSGCFSSHSEFKSHLIPASMLPPAPARLQSGAVSWRPRGRDAGRGGWAVAQQHLPAPPGPASPGKGRVWSPATPSPAQRESAPATGLRFPGKAWWYGAACGGRARDAPSPDPFCPTSTKLGLAAGSGVTSKLVTCQFCIPFLHFHLPKFLLLLPHSALWCGRR